MQYKYILKRVFHINKLNKDLWFCINKCMFLLIKNDSFL